jgi:tRNA A-37 threonylcarbamoyl transferase component Bud32
VARCREPVVLGGKCQAGPHELSAVWGSPALSAHRHGLVARSSRKPHTLSDRSSPPPVHGTWSLAEHPEYVEALNAALAGRYELQGEIGRGGMATVYLARDLRHDSRVAVKVLRPELALAMGAERFAREIRITASLQHPHILPILDSGEAAGTVYFVMPFVEGESLQQRLQRETRLPVEEAVRLVAEVADGLAHAHAAGFIHRDIKPGNILLSHGHAVLADFGIARALDVSAADRLTETGLSVGTVTYMSPEQAHAGRLDGRSDIYSLGCVLYESLAGTPPFTGPSAQAIMARSAIDPVPSIRTVRQVVPQALEAAINKALAKVPEDRFATAAEFRDEMPIITDTVVRAARPWWRTRRAMLAAAVVALGAVLAVWRRTIAHPPLNPNRVIVYPFVLPSDWPGARTAGEDIATVIGSAMDGAGSLRWVDGWTLLPPAERENSPCGRRCGSPAPSVAPMPSPAGWWRGVTPPTSSSNCSMCGATRSLRVPPGRPRVSARAGGGGCAPSPPSFPD